MYTIFKDNYYLIQKESTLPKKRVISSNSSKQLELNFLFNPSLEMDSKIVFKGDVDFFRKAKEKRENEEIIENIINSVKDLD